VEARINDIIKTQKDLGDFFPNITVKEKAFEHDFPRPLHPMQTIDCKRFTRSDIGIVSKLKNDILACVNSQLNIFDPLQMSGTIFLNMSEKADRDSVFGLSYFRAIWENREMKEILSEMFSGTKFGPSFFELRQEVINETYRQILLTSVDLQRRI